MTTPMFSVTSDDARYYQWPDSAHNHLPSITTVIKQGVPKPFLQVWAIKQVAETALKDIELLSELLEKAK